MGMGTDRQLTDTQNAYIDFMCEVDRGTKADFARDHSISDETLRRWEKTEWYKDEIEQRMRDLYLGPERVLEVIRAVQKNAAKGDLQAQKLYMQYLDRLNPIKPSTEDRSVAEMTDDELERAWQEAGGRAV